MAKNGDNPPYGVLQMIVAQPTSLPIQVSEVYRVFESKVNKSTGMTQAKLVGPVAIPQGVEEAIDRILGWFAYMYDDPGGTVINPYAGKLSIWKAMSEDVDRIRIWRDSMKGKVTNAQSNAPA